MKLNEDLKNKKENGEADCKSEKKNNIRKTLNEAQILDKLGISDFSLINKDKIMNFMSILPEIDNEVAIKIIDQFPAFSKNSVDMIEKMKDLCNKVLEDDKVLTTQSIEAYKQILDDLSIMLKKEDIEEVERKNIAEKMIEVADRIGLKVNESKEFKIQVLKTIGGIIVGSVVISGAIFGVKFIETNKD